MRASIGLNPASLFTRVLFTAITVGLFIGAVVSGWDNVRYWGAPSVPGVVVEHEYSPLTDKEGRTSAAWKIVVEWTDENGQTWRTPSSVSSSDPREIGEEVRVQYIPGNQGMVRLDTWAEKWLGSTILAGIGLVFSLFTGYAFWSAHRVRKMNEQVAADPFWNQPAPGYPPTDVDGTGHG